MVNKNCDIETLCNLLKQQNRRYLMFDRYDLIGLSMCACILAISAGLIHFFV